MAQTVKVLNSVAALGVDASVSGGALSILGVNIPLRTIKSSVITPYAAGTLQVNTVTPTAANSTFYSYNVNGLSSIDNRTKTWNVQFTSVAATATATTICDQIRAGLKSQYDFPYTLDGTATVTITGIAGNNVFASAQDSASVGVLTTALTTPAVQAVGAGTLIAAGNILPLAGDTQIVTTNNYTTVTIHYNDNVAVQTRSNTYPTLNSLVLYVNQGDSDYLSLVGTYGTITQAVKGVKATWVASTGNPAVADGVITLTTDVFYGNTDTNIGSQWLAVGGQGNCESGDVIYVGTAPYVIASVLTGATAATSNIPNDATGAAGFYVQLRSAY